MRNSARDTENCFFLFIPGNAFNRGAGRSDYCDYYSKRAAGNQLAVSFGYSASGNACRRNIPGNCRDGISGIRRDYLCFADRFLAAIYLSEYAKR